VQASILWDSYLAWAADRKERPLDRRVFSARLEGRGFRKQRVGHDRTWTWFGLCVKSSESEATPGSNGDADGCGRETPIVVLEEDSLNTKQ
jgi:hypothetical protein